MTTLPMQFEHQRLDIASVAPGAYKAMAALGAAVRLDPVLHELVKLRASILNGCAYCVDMHTLDAAAAGETEQRLHAVAVWHEAPFFSGRERAALALTDAVTLLAQTHVPREVYDAACEHFDEAELAQLIMAIVAINAWNRIAVTTRMLPGEYAPAS